MSFAINVKNEITKYEGTKTENIALLSGFVRNNGNVTKEKLELITENSSIAKKIYQLFKDIYNIQLEIDTIKNINLSKKSLYHLEITEQTDKILADLSIYENDDYLQVPKDYIVSEEEEQRCYLMGAFLSKGSINDPKTARYHLEFLIETKKEAEFIQGLLNNFNLNSKVLSRDKGYMVYIKEAEKIGDFLRIVYASNAVMYYEDIRIYRDHKNMVNRLNNCEQANYEKSLRTGDRQLSIISFLKDNDYFTLLDEKTRQVAEYRLKYPEVSFQALADILSGEINKKVTKSYVNHHFRKINEIYENINKTQNIQVE